MKRWIILLIVIVLAAGAAFWWFGASSKQAKTTPFRTGIVDRGTVKTVVSATGTASAVTTVSVGSQVSGTLLQVLVDFNSPVKKGQVIARIDPTFLATSVKEAEASLEKAKATLAQAIRDSVRVTSLFAKDLGSQVDFDNAVTAVEQARAGVSQAEAQLSRARTNYDNSVITSPIDGVVISRNVDVGQTVAASLQAPELFTIAQDLHKMQIETHIDEADIGSLKEGMKADFTVDSYPDEHFAGTIRQVRYAAKTDQSVVTYPVIIDVENPELKLRPGMTANVTIVTAKREDVLRIPASALRFKPTEDGSAAKSSAGGSGGSPVQGQSRRGSGKRETAKDSSSQETVPGIGGTVYLKSATGKPEVRKVRVGLNDGTFAEILSGEIASGDTVIIGMTGKSSSQSGSSSIPGMGPGGPRR